MFMVIHPYQSLSMLIGQSDALAASGKQSLTSSRSSLLGRLARLRTALFPASLIDIGSPFLSMESGNWP